MPGFETKGVFRVADIDLDTLVQSYDPDHPEYFLDVIYQRTIVGEKNHMCWNYNANSLRLCCKKENLQRLRERSFATERVLM